jgi:hypothetical protein
MLSAPLISVFSLPSCSSFESSCAVFFLSFIFYSFLCDVSHTCTCTNVFLISVSSSCNKPPFSNNSVISQLQLSLLSFLNPLLLHHPFLKTLEI